MTDIPLCSLCASQGRATRVFATVSGWVICPICDRNIPPIPTGTTHMGAHIIDPATQPKEKP